MEDFFFIASPSDSADGDVSANSGGSDYWAFKIRGDGTMEWEKNYGGAGSEGSPGGAMVSEGEYALVGRSDSAEGDVSGNYGKGDLWLVRIGDTTTTSLENASGKGDLDIYPNPTKGTFPIDLDHASGDFRGGAFKGSVGMQQANGNEMGP